MFYVALAKQIGLIDPKIPWFNTQIAPVIENEVASIHRNIKMATHTTVEHRWPDLRVKWKKKQLIEVFDMACPLDSNVTKKEKKRSGITVNCATAYEDKTQRKELYFTH